ncbi:MAG: MmgE/PrpD family protein [Pseudomonadota bacterium]
MVEREPEDRKTGNPGAFSQGAEREIDRNGIVELSRLVGDFLASVRYEDIPDDCRSIAIDAFIDTVAVMMAGVREPVVSLINKEVLRPEPTEARVCLSDVSAWAPDAALVGGTAAHAHDLDDQSLTGHPSAILVPTILAEADSLECNGREMITAYVAGYEVWAELIRRSSDYHQKGWHPTSVFGVVASAAAVSVLRKLTSQEAVRAMAIAASHAGGLAANFGTMTKPYHAGFACKNGVLSARLAAAGMTATDDPFENAKGFLVAFGPDKNPDLESESLLGRDWYLARQKLCVKKYPTCYFMHRSFDAALKLTRGRILKGADVQSVEVFMGSGQATVLVYDRPQTGLQAKFSEQFAMAAALILGKMGIEELRDEVVQRQDIQAFFPKVSITPVDESDERDPAHSPTERVVITLNNGEVLDSGPVRTIPGHADEPLTEEELWDKFKYCTAETHSDSEARSLFETLKALPDLDTVHEIPIGQRIFQR